MIWTEESCKKKCFSIRFMHSWTNRFLSYKWATFATADFAQKELLINILFHFSTQPGNQFHKGNPADKLRYFHEKKRNEKWFPSEFEGSGRIVNGLVWHHCTKKRWLDSLKSLNNSQIALIFPGFLIDRFFSTFSSNFKG